MIKKKVEKSGIEIDLTGPQGNAYYLLGLAHDLAKQLDWDPGAITKEMRDTHDYDLLVEVFDKHFGNIVTLYR